MSVLLKANRLLARFCLIVGGGLMLWLTLLNFVNVVARYVFQQPIVWAEEALRFSTIWMVMLAAAVVTLEGTQIAFENLWQSLPSFYRWIVAVVIDVGTLLLSIWIVIIGWETTMRILAGGQTAIASGLPIWVMYLSWPVGFALFAIFLLERIGRLIARPGQLEKPVQPLVFD